MQNDRDNLLRALAALQTAYADISKIDASENVRFQKARLLSNLQKDINSLASNLGEPLLNSQLNSVSTGQPLKTFLGRKLAPAPGGEGGNAREERAKPMTADEVALQELKAAASILYGQISTMQNDAVIDSYTDLEIRAVAKMADLPVTETSPKNITSSYVDKIKEAITKKNAPILPNQPVATNPKAPVAPAPVNPNENLDDDSEDDKQETGKEETGSEQSADNKLSASTETTPAPGGEGGKQEGGDASAGKQEKPADKNQPKEQPKNQPKNTNSKQGK